MSKIVFFCIPAYGHTNPTLGVVRELTARGHEVRYYSYEPMRTLIEAAGAQFVACDPYDCEQPPTPPPPMTPPAVISSVCWGLTIR